MASPTPFYRILCLVICVSLAWFSVVAKPIELPALSQRQYEGNLSYTVDAVEGVRNEGTRSVDDHLPASFTIATSTCIDAAPNIHTLTW